MQEMFINQQADVIEAFDEPACNEEAIHRESA